MEGGKRERKREKERETRTVKKMKNENLLLTGVASFWRPSRGPTSTMVTREGRSAPRRRCFFVVVALVAGEKTGGVRRERVFFVPVAAVESRRIQ